jgi:hypothetical protein
MRELFFTIAGLATAILGVFSNPLWFIGFPMLLVLWVVTMVE